MQKPGADACCLAFTQPAAPGVAGREGEEVELCPGGRDREVDDDSKVRWMDGLLGLLLV